MRPWTTSFAAWIRRVSVRYARRKNPVSLLRKPRATPWQLTTSWPQFPLSEPGKVCCPWRIIKKSGTSSIRNDGRRWCSRDRDRLAAALFLVIDKYAASFLAGVSHHDFLALRVNDFLH